MRIQPILKWAGGKRWLSDCHELTQLGSFERYFEPFLGGAATFFSLLPDQAVLGDANLDLINLYRVIRDDPDKLRRAMALHQAWHSDAHYYEARTFKPSHHVDAAARFLYLNRTCWNGLYRVNLKGEFNVPRGTKNTVLDHRENFIAASAALNRAQIHHSDFEEIVDQAQDGDLVFCDPPYTVKHNLNGFLKYNERIFSWADQIRLKESLERAVARGARVILTNADHEEVKELFGAVLKYRPVYRASVLAADGERRGRVSEALFVANL